ncbi:MAG: outer membrane protein assembly factor BamE [Holosporales bacterium]|nr:outer membrane protein assembly factor BamE [Holosporales bacterium]
MTSACEKTVINHGYAVKREHFKKITVGKDDARAVYLTFGAPTMRSSVVSEDGSHSWYYVSKRTEKTSFLTPVVIDQVTVIVTFDRNGIVKSVKESSYEKTISTVSEKTETKGKTRGAIRETFGGLGKYMSRFTDDKKK